MYNDLFEIYGTDEPAITYAVDVLNGNIITGKKIKLACQRFIDELRKVEYDDFKYYYDSKAVASIVDFSGLLVNLDDRTNFNLTRFQKFILSQIQGWKTKDGQGFKYSRALISMARANGKTAILSVVLLYRFLFGQPATNRELGIVSQDLPHAEALYKYCDIQWKHLSGTKQFKTLANKLGIESNQREFRIKSQATTLRKMSASSATTSDGLGHMTLSIFDEYHLFTNRDYVNSVTSGQMFMPYAQTIFISTSGSDPAHSPMYEDYNYYSRLLTSGNYDELENVLFLCWEQDSDDEAYPDDYDIWQKSNPLFEIEAMKQSAIKKMKTERDEKATGGKLSAFITKNLNRWSASGHDDSFLTMPDIERAVGGGVEIDGRDCYVGIDYSLTSDNTSVAFVFPNGDKDNFYIKEHSFIPWQKAGSIEAKERLDKINYRDVESKGFCTITADQLGMINHDQVYSWLLDFIDEHDLQVKGVLYDPNYLKDFIAQLESQRPEWLLIPVKQTTMYLSEPTKFLQDGIIRGNITIDDNDCLKTGLANAVTVVNYGGMKVDKMRNSEKIDSVDSVVTALFEGMYYFSTYSNQQADKNSPFSGMSQAQINDFYTNKFSF